MPEMVRDRPQDCRRQTRAPRQEEKNATSGSRNSPASGSQNSPRFVSCRHQEIWNDFNSAANFGIPNCYIDFGGELLSKALGDDQELRLPSPDPSGRHCAQQKAESLIEPIK